MKILRKVAMAISAFLDVRMGGARHMVPGMWAIGNSSDNKGTNIRHCKAKHLSSIRAANDDGVGRRVGSAGNRCARMPSAASEYKENGTNRSRHALRLLLWPRKSDNFG